MHLMLVRFSEYIQIPARSTFNVLDAASVISLKASEEFPL
jgi:hypothetical protein